VPDSRSATSPASQLPGRLLRGQGPEHTYELAQATVKKALAILKDERLIETTPGYGTFVRDRGQDI
jgi:DNA-binding GntR family transcriptional regulator